MKLHEFLSWCLVLMVVTVWIGVASYPAWRLICDQHFTGVWSTTSVEDCEGLFWPLTYSDFLFGVEGGLHTPVEGITLDNPE